MISYVEGPLMAIEEGVIMVEAGYVGLAIRVPVSLPPELPGMGKEVTVYTYFQVREDAMTLYGFLHSQDRNMFKQLLGVNGVGPREALGILSVLRPDNLRLITVSEDVKVLAKVPGIGNETARYLILDLKDKVSMDNVLGNMAGGTGMGAADTGASVASLVEATKEVVQALVALGYTNTEASRTMKQVEVTDGMTSEDAPKTPLKHLSFLQGFWQASN